MGSTWQQHGVSLVMAAGGGRSSRLPACICGNVHLHAGSRKQPPPLIVPVLYCRFTFPKLLEQCSHGRPPPPPRHRRRGTEASHICGFLLFCQGWRARWCSRGRQRRRRRSSLWCSTFRSWCAPPTPPQPSCRQRVAPSAGRCAFSTPAAALGAVAASLRTRRPFITSLAFSLWPLSLSYWSAPPRRFVRFVC